MKAVACAVVLLALASAGSVCAEPASGPEPKKADVEAARRHFRRGVELYKEDSFDAALAEFNKANQLAPDYRLLYNLGQVQSERHDYVAALQLFERYLKQGGREVSAERRAQVEQELAALRHRVAELSVTANVGGGELFVDGVSAGELPLKEPVLVSTGVHQLQLRKPSYRTSTRTLTIAGGESSRVKFQLQPEASGPGETPGSRARERGSGQAEADGGANRTPLWISLVSTGVLAGGAVTFAVLTRKADRDLDKELDRFPSDGERIDDARSDLKRNAALTDAFTAAAVIAGGFSLYFAISSPSASDRGEKAARKGLEGVSIGAAGPGVRLFGNF
jgi:hypothetical protein